MAKLSLRSSLVKYYPIIYFSYTYCNLLQSSAYLIINGSSTQRLSTIFTQTWNLTPLISLASSSGHKVTDAVKSLLQLSPKSIFGLTNSDLEIPIANSTQFIQFLPNLVSVSIPFFRFHISSSLHKSDGCVISGNKVLTFFGSLTFFYNSTFLS